MFLFLSKLLAPLVYPLGAAACLWAAAALLGWRGRTVGARRCLLAGIAVILAASNPMAAGLLLGSLESRYPPAPVEEYPRADAIVVLGGATLPPLPPRIEVEVNGSFDRLLHGLRLLRAGRAPRLILSGGAVSFLTGSSLPEAARMARLAAELGVEPGQLLLESRSRNTRENAVHTARLLEERGLKRVLLVTSARHMPRAAAVFRKAGVDLVPAPTDFRVVDKPFSPWRLLPDLEALESSTRAVKEYAGLVVYRLRGWL